MKNRHNGFIKIDRQIIEWEHFKDHKTFKLFIVLLLLAAYEDTTAPDGTKLKRGQVLTSLKKLSEISGLTVDEIRPRICTMICTKELTNLSSPKNRIITVLNYDKYQNIPKGLPKGLPKDLPNIEEDNTTYYLLRNKKEIGGGIADASPAEKHEVTRADFDSDEEYEAWRNQ